MKYPITVTRLLKKVDEVFTTLEQLRRSLEHKNKSAFTVTFYHKDKVLVHTRWSDQYGTSPQHTSWNESYEYEITSRGIHFHSYSIKELNDQEWNSKSWYMSQGDSQISLLHVPNIPPPNTVKSMYLFHQEQIRKALSQLPAWAIVCGTGD